MSSWYIWRRAKEIGLYIRYPCMWKRRSQNISQVGRGRGSFLVLSGLRDQWMSSKSDKSPLLQDNDWQDPHRLSTEDWPESWVYTADKEMEQGPSNEATIVPCLGLISQPDMDKAAQMFCHVSNCPHFTPPSWPRWQGMLALWVTCAAKIHLSIRSSFRLEKTWKCWSQWRVFIILCRNRDI